MDRTLRKYERMRNANKILVRKPEGKRPLRKYKHRWGNIKMDLK
jgi:hypothetical protein